MGPRWVGTPCIVRDISMPSCVPSCVPTELYLLQHGRLRCRRGLTQSAGGEAGQVVLGLPGARSARRCRLGSPCPGDCAVLCRVRCVDTAKRLHVFQGLLQVDASHGWLATLIARCNSSFVANWVLQDLQHKLQLAEKGKKDEDGKTLNEDRCVQLLAAGRGLGRSESLGCTCCTAMVGRGRSIR